MQLLQCAYAVKIAALQIENQTREENQEKFTAQMNDLSSSDFSYQAFPDRQLNSLKYH